MELRLAPVTVPLVARSADASRAVEAAPEGGFAGALRGALGAVSSAQTSCSTPEG